MVKILEKEVLNSDVSRMKLLTPLISKKARPGQFIILRVDETGERIPLTIFKSDEKYGTIEIIYQKIGVTTIKLDEKNAGDSIADVVGPLGKPSEIKGYKKAIVVFGGVGSAIGCPLAAGLKENGCKTEIVAGFRSKDIIILENEMKSIDENAVIVTDDGSNGKKALVTEPLEEKLSKIGGYDLVIAVGPIPMMRAVCNVTKKYGVKTIVSMNSIMIDGTGMCGGCRLKVDGKIKFACVDGPDFDGHLVDFQEISARNRTFSAKENEAKRKYCNLFKGV